MRTLIRFTALVLAVLVFWALPMRAGPVAAASITVNIGDDFYANSPTNTCPSPPAACMTNVHVGDTVHWVWTGLNPHSTTSDVAGWDSGTHGNGFTFDHTFNTAESFAYHCNVHPTMHGTIVVTQSVGGIAELPNVAGAPMTSPAASGDNGGLIAGVLAGATGAVALAGAAFYVGKRRVH